MAISKQIPTIDIAPYIDASSSQEARTKVVTEVKNACSRYGFLQITGHGIPLYAQKRVLECCETLFALPVEQKERLSLKNSPSRHGYERMKEQILDKKAFPDEKEASIVSFDRRGCC